MKALIWILTFLLGSILNTLIGYAIGIKAGAVLLYIAEFYIAKKLCEKWDQRKEEKQSTKQVQNAENIIEPNVVVESIPASIEQPVVTNDNPERKIMYCRRCGSKLIEGSEFCSKCGTQIEKEGAE